MMLMKKITFNALLNHKAHNYKPMQIEVEKVIPLYGKRFEQMRDHPLDDCPEIIESRELMYMEGNTTHCILFLDANGSDGILVEAEGADYARKSQFIPNARAIVEANDITAGEHQLHAELRGMAERIAELAHTGQKNFTFEDMLGDEDLRVLMIRTVAEMLDRREDLAEVRDHYLGITGQADFTVTAKPAQEMKLYCPLEIQAEPQIYETDWDAPYEDDLEVIPSSCACGSEDEINAAIEKYSEPEEKHCGLMIYYNEDSPVNEKVISAYRRGNASRQSLKRFQNWGIACAGVCLTLPALEYHSPEKGYSLSDILEKDVPAKYYLSDEAMRKMEQKENLNS